MLTINNITHTYGKGGRAVTALGGVSAQFPTGASALLGPNGSGKSTLMNIIATQIAPTSGQITFNGRTVDKGNLQEYRSALGVVPQHITLPPHMRVMDVLSYLCWVHQVPKAQNRAVIDAVLERLELGFKAQAAVGSLSGGQLRRAGFACAMLHNPQLLLLDEPTVGLDPEVRIEIRSLIAELARSATVILSTHLLEDVRYLQPHVVMIKDGTKVFGGSYREFTAALPGHTDDTEQAYQGFLRSNRGEAR